MVEIILVVAIISSLSAMVYSSGTKFFIKNHLDNTRNNLISSLRTAQINTMSGKGELPWGVKVISNEIILFSGNDFASRDTVYDEKFGIPDSVTCDQSEIVFLRPDGDILSVVQINIADNIGQSVLVSMNEEGIVNVD